MPTSRFVDIRQLALLINLSDSVSAVGEVNISLRIDDKARPRVGQRVRRNPGKRCGHGEKNMQSRFHTKECGAQPRRKLAENCKLVVKEFSPPPPPPAAPLKNKELLRDLSAHKQTTSGGVRSQPD